MEARQKELAWPQGWSRERIVATLGVYSQRYATALCSRGEGLFVLGIFGERTDMVLQLHAFSPSGEALSTEPLILSDPAFYLDWPAVSLGPDGRKHIFWVEEGTGDRQLKYLILHEDYGVFRDEQVVLQSPRRLSSVQTQVDEEGRVHLLWTGRGATGLEIFYTRFSPQGDMLIEPRPITDSPGFSYGGILLPDPWALNIAWVEVSPEGALLQFQSYDDDLNPRNDVTTLDLVSQVDQLGNPLLEARVSGFVDGEGAVHLLYNGQIGGPLFGKPGSNIYYARLWQGEFQVFPRNLTPLWSEAHRPYVSGGGGVVHGTWEERGGDLSRVMYTKLGQGGDSIQEPLALNIATHPSFQPRIHGDDEGFAYAFWFRFFDDSRHIQLSFLNTRYPVGPSLWHRLGIGDQEPLQSVFYVLGLSGIMSFFQAFSQIHLLILTVLVLQALCRYWDLKGYSFFLSLLGLFLLLILQETGLYLQPHYGGPGFEILSALLAAALAYLFYPSLKTWWGFQDTLSQSIFLGVFLYGFTFFSHIPHYILESLP